MDADGYGLTVENVPREKYRQPRVPAGSEPCGDGLDSGLPDLRGMPLGDVAAAVKDGDAALKETLRRIAPEGGRTLLVAASFNSAI